MRSDGGRYNTSMMQNIGESMAGSLVFLAQNWRIIAPIIGAIGWFVNRENDDEKKRKPELIDQIVATAQARCEPQVKYPQVAPYDARLKESVSEARSQAFDRYMNHKVTLCLNQNLPEFKGGNFLSKSFYGAYHYNNGEPVLSLWDKGKVSKDAGIFEDKINERSEETLNKFAHDFLTTTTPTVDMLAYKASKSCGDDCTTYYIKWVPADEFKKGIAQVPAMATAPLKAERPPVAYKTW